MYSNEGILPGIVGRVKRIQPVSFAMNAFEIPIMMDMRYTSTAPLPVDVVIAAMWKPG